MDIISIPFALLAIVSVFIFYLLNPKYRTTYLIFLSCCFTACFNYYLLIYVILYSLFNYYIGLKIAVSRFRKTIFILGIIVNLSQLVILKYSYTVSNPILQIFNSNLNLSKLSEVIVPLGISFFTLQGIGYLINIKMGWEKSEKKFLNFLLYIIFYPKFLSGPIERSNHFLPQLNIIQSFNVQQVTEGLRTALFGFFKKVVIANQLCTVINNAYSDLNLYSGYTLWIVIFIQPLYLYFDFSGYTDIAIGLAKAYGIELLPNFNRPFLSENITTFWKRFHMSLSLWFNDYVFKQISFRYRRWGNYASVFAVLVTFALFGIWHGAGLNFMALGLVQGVAVIFEFFTKKKRMSIFGKIPDFYRIWLGRIFTYLFYSVALIFFFSPDFSTALSYFPKLNIFNHSPQKIIFGEFFALAILCCIVLFIADIIYSDFKENYVKLENYWTNHKFLRVAVYYAVTILILSLLSGNVSFIYQLF